MVEVAGVKHTLEDEYQWLRGKAWPKLVEDEDIIAHLEAENAYCKDFLASLGGLQEAFFQTMKGRMKLTDRTVTLDDYELGAENVAGVARALMVTSDQVEGVAENRGFLYIVPDGGGLASSQKDMMKKPRKSSRKSSGSE